MAPALTSNSFRLTAGGVYSKPAAAPTKPAKKPSTVVYAKRKDSSSSDDNASNAKPSNPFFIDFGKIPDAKSLIPVITSSSTPFFTTLRRKDPKTVFVAGATGQAGVRIVQTLLRQGFSVRAGVPELAAAQELARLAVEYKIISPDESKRLNAVESTFADAESIARAIGPAAKAVVTVSAAENGPSAAVTAEDALQLLRAAQLAGVSHVALVFDESTSGPGGSSTYNVLDGITTFFSNLFSRSQTLSLTELLAKVAEETDVAYTFIKASLADDYSVGADLSLVISNDGAAAAATAISGTSTVSKVSRSQIAALVAEVLSDTSVTENKVFEVSTSSLASSKPIAELLRAIPEDGRRKAYAEAKAKATAAEEALIASERTREAADATKKLEVGVKKLSKQQGRASSVAEEAQERAEAAGSSIEGLLSKAKSFSGDFSWEKVSSQIATAVAQKPADEPRTQVVTVRGQAKAKSLTPQKAVVKKPAPKQKPKQTAPKPEVKSVFGGLFKQETIYIDEV